jgi:hypothetical protein
MPFTAFKNDPTVKQAALDDAREARHPGWASTASSEDRNALSDLFGIDPALINLFGFIYRVPYGDDYATPLVEALNSIPLGADTRSIVRRWILDVWESPDLGAQPHILNTELHAATAKVVELVKASAAAPIARDEWRRARSGLSAAKAALPELTHYADLAAAMAWDIATTPGVTTDVWHASEAVAYAPLRTASNWSKAAEDAVVEDARLAMRQTYEEIGPPPDSADASQNYQKQHSIVFQRKLKDLGQAENYASWLEFAGRAGPVLRQWHATALTSVLQACRG